MRTRMTGWTTVVAMIFSAAVLVAGCETAPDRLNAPPQGQTDRPSKLQDNYARMVDGALLNERSMSPVHFVSGSAELNSLGVRRLNRYATLLKVYGGELNYDGVDDAPELAQQRVYQIEKFLTSAGVGSDLVSVAVGPAGGKGFRGTEAGEARGGLTASADCAKEAQKQMLTDRQ